MASNYPLIFRPRVPSPSHTCDVGFALRRLARDVVGRLEQAPVVLPGDGGEVEQRPRALGAAIKREAIEGVKDGLAATPKQIAKARAPSAVQDDNFTVKHGRVFNLRVGSESDIIA